MSEYIPCLSFWVWVTSLQMFFFLVPSICIQISRCHCFFSTEKYSTVYMYHIFFIHSLLEERLGCFQVLAIIHNAAMSIAEQMSLWYVCASFEYIPKSSIAGSWGRLISDFLKSCNTYFQSGYTSLHSCQQWRGVPLTLHPVPYKLSLVFLILVILSGIRWSLRFIFICIFLMAKDVE